MGKRLPFTVVVRNTVNKNGREWVETSIEHVLADNPDAAAATAYEQQMERLGWDGVAEGSGEFPAIFSGHHTPLAAVVDDDERPSCDACGGTGYAYFGALEGSREEECPECHGTGARQDATAL